MGSKIECYRHSPGGRNPHLSRCKALTLGAAHAGHAPRGLARALQSGFGVIPGFVYSTET